MTALFLITLVFVVFCLYMAKHAVLSYQKANESSGWPTTEATLVDVHLWGTRNIDGKMVEAENLSVAYEYCIDGNKYSGRKVSFYRLHFPETIQFAEAHPKDSRMTAYYNPSEHTDSVLIPGLHPTKPYGGLILAVLGVCASVAVSIAAWVGVL